MKKFLLIVGILSIAGLTLGAAGFAYAQRQTLPTPEYPYGHGMPILSGIEMMGDYDGYGYSHEMMGSWYEHGYGHGMMGLNGEHEPMHEAMIAALAVALDLTPEEIEARHDVGETLWQIAEAEGLSAEEIQDLMFSAHDFALEDAVANGWMTEEQAEWMDGHMQQMWDGEYGPGDHCGGGGDNHTRWQGDN